jgi:hypothetical protein
LLRLTYELGNLFVSRMTKVYPKVSEEYALNIERARRKLRGLIAGKSQTAVQT